MDIEQKELFDRLVSQAIGLFMQFLYTVLAMLFAKALCMYGHYYIAGLVYSVCLFRFINLGLAAYRLAVPLFILGAMEVML